jgi:hypothetical protein
MNPSLISNLFGEPMNTRNNSLNARPQASVRLQAAGLFLAFTLVMPLASQAANTSNTASNTAK